MEPLDPQPIPTAVPAAAPPTTPSTAQSTGAKASWGPRLNKILASTLAALTLFCLGAVVGAFIAKMLYPTQMGWDQLANVLGGFMVGGLVSLPVSILLILRTPTRWLYLTALLAASSVFLLGFLGRALRASGAG